MAVCAFRSTMSILKVKCLSSSLSEKVLYEVDGWSLDQSLHILSWRELLEHMTCLPINDIAQHIKKRLGFAT
jgi:hypothetical protein